jgi:hypothetical protein
MGTETTLGPTRQVQGTALRTFPIGPSYPEIREEISNQADGKNQQEALEYRHQLSPHRLQSLIDLIMNGRIGSRFTDRA